jgi:EEF1A lysine methyltransferase 1
MDPLPGARLLEYDQRFSVLSPKQFIPYDLNEPDTFPASLREHFDVVVIDPPYLNEVSQTSFEPPHLCVDAVIGHE